MTEWLRWQGGMPFATFQDGIPLVFPKGEPMRFREWRTNALFQNLQLITRLLSSTVDLVQTYQKPVGY